MWPMTCVRPCPACACGWSPCQPPIIGQLRAKIGPDPANPSIVRTEPGTGYGAVMCGRLRLRKGFDLSGSDRRRLRSFVRPVCAGVAPAGPDEVRVPGPDQKDGLGRPDRASGCLGRGSVRSSSLTSALAFRGGGIGASAVSSFKRDRCRDTPRCCQGITA